MRSLYLARLLWSAINPDEVESARRPDVILDDALTGEVYLKRWWLIPRNPVFNLYLHKLVSSDPAQEFHDHPWGNLSIVLDGGYVEWIATDEGGDTTIRRFERSEGDLVFRGGSTTHRIDLHKVSDQCRASGERISWEEQCWTLFATGPRLRRWGFKDIITGRWTAWRDYCRASKGVAS